MAFGFGIERDNYIIYFGWPAHWLGECRYIFRGWLNEDTRKNFFGSVNFLAQEAAAKRVFPPLSQAHILHVTQIGDELESVGTPVGSILKVAYDKRFSDPEKIEEFFFESHIGVQRANPFEKPVYTLWKYLRIRLFGKKP